MTEDYEMMYVTDEHKRYGRVHIIMVHPNEWEDFKKRTPAITWKEVAKPNDPTA